MDDRQRANAEKEIARAVLILWIFFDSEIKKAGRVDYLAFKSLFDQQLRPALTQVYGTARNTLANRFGHQYQTRPSATGQVVSLPGMATTIDAYATDLFETFNRRHQSPPPTPQGEAPRAPDYTEDDADRWSVTNVTSAKARGEIDAASDVESRVGKRLVAYWKTEPGACPKCAALEGQPWRVWRLVFPEGPPAHPHCRCDLVWRELLE